jgi:hypothetical protein
MLCSHSPQVDGSTVMVKTMTSFINNPDVDKKIIKSANRATQRYG